MGRQTTHVGRRNNMSQKVNQTDNACANRNLVFPFKLSPHGTESFVRARGGANIIHNVHVDVVEVNIHLFARSGIVVNNGAENMPSLR